MKVAIFGAFGTIGRSAAAALSHRGVSVRVVGRSLSKLEEAFGRDPSFELVPADLATAEGCSRASQGVDAIVYSLGLPYTKEAFSAYPAMMRRATEAARAARVRRLLLIANVYSYGPPRSSLVSEDHPREPSSVKGRWRKEQEDVALAAHTQGDLETLVLRLPDFYGPFAEMSIGNMILIAAVPGKTAKLLGPIDTPHEFTFTPDLGPVIHDLLHQSKGWGEAYNLAGVRSITVREFARLAYAAAGTIPKLQVAAPWMVRLLGLASPLMGELSEMSYLQTHAVLLDDAKLQRLLGPVQKTSYEEGIERTVKHLREHAR